MQSSFKFIDLFAGLGGFHYALKSIGGECVFASEINKTLRDLYIENHNFKSDLMHGDIAECINKIPEHDILAAGFPCQPFSKSGKQLGFDDNVRGDCIFYALDIIKKKKPKYFILENVGNFARHNNGNSWKDIQFELRELGYTVRSTADNIDNGGYEKLISPHHFGYPQKRERFFAVGSLDYIPKDIFPIPNEKKPNLETIIIPKKKSKLSTDKLIDIDQCKIGTQALKAIKLWNNFIDALPNKNKDITGAFPLWLEEFDATYPYISHTPYQSMLDDGFSKEDAREKLLNLPPYAREEKQVFPLWKIRFIDQNREWFNKNKAYIDKSTVKKIRKLDYTFRKLEWNWKASESSNIWDHTIQLRPSGIRVSNPSYVPSIVSMCATQRPIHGPFKRHLTKREIARAFGFPDSLTLPTNATLALSALGNAVHKDVARLVAQKLMNYGNRYSIENNLIQLKTTNQLESLSA